MAARACGDAAAARAVCRCRPWGGARHLPRGQLELRVNSDLPDPTQRILVVCEFGHISTLAAATLRELGFTHATALDGGMKAWREGNLPMAKGDAP